MATSLGFSNSLTHTNLKIYRHINKILHNQREEILTKESTIIMADAKPMTMAARKSESLSLSIDEVI